MEYSGRLLRAVTLSLPRSGTVLDVERILPALSMKSDLKLYSSFKVADCDPFAIARVDWYDREIRSHEGNSAMALFSFFAIGPFSWSRVGRLAR